MLFVPAKNLKNIKKKVTKLPGNADFSKLYLKNYKYHILWGTILSCRVVLLSIDVGRLEYDRYTQFIYCWFWSFHGICG